MTTPSEILETQDVFHTLQNIIARYYDFNSNTYINPIECIREMRRKLEEMEHINNRYILKRNSERQRTRSIYPSK